MKNITFFLFLLFILSCKSSVQTGQLSPTDSSPRIAFYNVENLFDLVDDPLSADEDFTPDGKQKWTSERYAAKLDNIAKVIEGMAFPSFVGLCEIENEAVLKDLVVQTQFGKHEYGIAHQESPDYRGIDVALLYNKDDFKVQETKAIRINFPAEIVENYTTRDILMVKGKYKKKHELYFFVNHWPSRRGGLEASEPKRTYVATQLKRAVDSLFAINPNVNIVIMGDFNDETDNKSVREVLQAEDHMTPILPAHLYNCFDQIDQANGGSYNFRGELNMLDQIIISGALADKKGLDVSNPQIFKQDWMIFKHEKYGETPNRTYGGPNYYGGTSDHFPVFVDMVWMKK